MYFYYYRFFNVFIITDPYAAQNARNKATADAV